MNWGRAIAVVRAARRFNHAQMAAGCLLNASYISAIERNRKIPSMDAVWQIAGVLQVPVFVLTFLASDAEDFHGHDPTSGNMGNLLMPEILKAVGVGVPA